MEELLLDGCRSGNLSQVSTALRSGADVHCYGDAALCAAAVRGYSHIVQHLWLHTDPPRHFHVGQGTLRRTAEKGYSEIALFLAPYATDAELAAAVAGAQRKGQSTLATCLAAMRVRT